METGGEINQKSAIKSWLIVAVSVLLVGTVAVLAGRHLLKPKFFDDQVVKQARFPLYYPARLPKGYAADKDSVSMGERVVVYQIKDPQGETLFVSLQPRPNNFDIVAFNKEIISQGTNLDTPIGAVTIGKLRDNQVASIITPETWILISNPGVIDQEDLKVIVRHLTPVDP